MKGDKNMEGKLEFENKDEKFFDVWVEYKVYGKVEVSAKSEEDLWLKLNNKDFIQDMPLPDMPDYLEDSYVIDYEATKGCINY